MSQAQGTSFTFVATLIVTRDVFHLQIDFQKAAKQFKKKKNSKEVNALLANSFKPNYKTVENDVAKLIHLCWALNNRFIVKSDWL